MPAAAARRRCSASAEYQVDNVYNVLDELPVERAGTIRGKLQRVEVEAGSTIARQGGPADKFVIVLDGEVEVVRESDGQSDTVTTLGPGDFFGEVAILERGPAYRQPASASRTRRCSRWTATSSPRWSASRSAHREFDSIVR